MKPFQEKDEQTDDVKKAAFILSDITDIMTDQKSSNL